MDVNPALFGSRKYTNDDILYHFSPIPSMGEITDRFHKSLQPKKQTPLSQERGVGNLLPQAPPIASLIQLPCALHVQWRRSSC